MTSAVTSAETCTACGSTQTAFLDDLVASWATQHRFHQRDRLFFCTACTALFRPDPIPQEYRDALYVQNVNEVLEINPENGWRRLAAYLDWNWLEKEWIKKVAGPRLAAPPDARVLDVGAKSGQAGFLYKLEGYQVDILEPTKTWAQFTRDCLGIPSIDAYYEPGSYPPQRFDLIFAGGVVHRVDPPPLFFEAARTHLKPGGFLYCREPNLFNMHAAFFQDLHRVYFTPYAFIRLCEAYGFEVVDWIDWSEHPRVPKGWNTAFSVLARLPEGTAPRPFSVAKPSLHDVRLAVTSAMLRIRMNEHLDRKRVPATIALWLRRAFGLSVTTTLLRLYGLGPRLLGSLARRLTIGWRG